MFNRTAASLAARHCVVVCLSVCHSEKIRQALSGMRAMAAGEEIDDTFGGLDGASMSSMEQFWRRSTGKSSRSSHCAVGSLYVVNHTADMEARMEAAWSGLAQDAVPSTGSLF